MAKTNFTISVDVEKKERAMEIARIKKFKISRAIDCYLSHMIEQYNKELENE